jgi:broad-specificity NMP kinase
MSNKKWMTDGKHYRQTGGGSIENTLPLGVYQVNFDPMSGWSLERTGDSFVFDYKLYGVHTGIVDRVLTAYPKLKGNFGVLFNGLKGTGKTVTAKILANKLELPVIIAKSFGGNNTALIEYLSSINSDCILFFDEFEKQFNEEDFSILQIMDGVYTSKYRRVFLLTTNNPSINENLLSRPSRIRYIKHFGNLELEVVKEYLQDNLLDHSCTEQLIAYLDTLIISTIDILKSIVEEINIFGFEEFMKTKEEFNVRAAKYNYDVFKVWAGRSLPSDPEILKEFLADYGKIAEIYRTQYALTEEQNESIFKPIKDKWHCSGDKRYLSNQNRFDTLKVGDEFGSCYEEVVAVGSQNNVVITTESDGDRHVYFILNPKAQASLYSQPASLII